MLLCDLLLRPNALIPARTPPENKLSTMTQRPNEQTNNGQTQGWEHDERGSLGPIMYTQNQSKTIIAQGSHEFPLPLVS